MRRFHADITVPVADDAGWVRIDVDLDLDKLDVNDREVVFRILRELIDWADPPEAAGPA